MSVAVSLLLVVFFLFMNAFFVIAEFSLVRVRKTQVEIMMEEERPGAKSAKRISENVNAYLSACQLGITLASLALGMLGEPAVSALIHEPLEAMGLGPEAVYGISVAVGYLIITTLHVVAGELVPKSFAILNTEKWALRTATPLVWFYRVTYPVMVVFNATTNGIMRLTGHNAADEHTAYTEEEIKILLEESAESGSLEDQQYQFMDNIFDLDDKDAESIMTPRTEILAIDVDDDLQTNLTFMIENQFTRYPVYRGDKDNIIGFVHIKDAYVLPEGSTMADLPIRDINPVPDSISVGKLLQLLQEQHTKMSLVIDEHGGTAGIVTMSDIVGTIIGRMEDEYLHDDQDEILKVADRTYLVDGSLPLDDFTEFLDFKPIEGVDYETVGGYVTDLMDKIPAESDFVELEQGGRKVSVIVKSMDGMRVDKVEVHFVQEHEPESAQQEEKDDQSASRRETLFKRDHRDSHDDSRRDDAGSAPRGADSGIDG